MDTWLNAMSRVLRGDHLLQLVDPQAAVVVHVDDADGRARLPRGARPRQQVGVVLRDGEDDLVTGAEIRRSPRAGDQIDRPRLSPAWKITSFGLGALMNARP